MNQIRSTFKPNLQASELSESGLGLSTRYNAGNSPENGVVEAEVGTKIMILSYYHTII
jgi:hypothetical protein